MRIRSLECVPREIVRRPLSQYKGASEGIIWERMEYASNSSWNMEYEHEKGNTGHSTYMKSGIWDHENYPISEYGKKEDLKLGVDQMTPREGAMVFSPEQLGFVFFLLL